MIAEAQRASPDALLELAQRERRGRLKIFLGAFPGAGKTYAMLQGGKAAKADGRDVVVGLVETHGRAETEAMAAGLETLPRQRIPYRNQVVQEFDLDAALARRPQVLLVDEYAHTNVPGSRHPKRWNDVQELLRAGIDVWTTLNVQHLEGLNDVMQQITRVRVRETIPDGVFDEADEVVLVDLPVDELLKRLAEGRVYVQDTATQAAKAFFRPENLTALRELTLRRAAERIDADLVEKMRAQAIEGPWAASERILACIGPDPVSQQVVRAAKRMADLMDATWIAATVERPGTEASASTGVAETMALAASLGAETRTLVATDMAAELLRLAHAENLTQIVAGRSGRGALIRLSRRSLTDDLVRRAEGVPIHVITARTAGAEGKRRPVTRRWSWRGQLRPVGSALVGVAAAVFVGYLLVAVTPTAFPNLSMLFLAAVVLTALAAGTAAAVWSALLSFVAYNFFFIEPIYTLTVAQPHEFLALVLYFVVALSVSTLAARVREQSQIATVNMRAIRRLYEYTRKLSGLTTEDKIVEGAAAEIHASLARPAVLLIGNKDTLTLRASWPPEEALDTASMSAARWARQHAEPTGAGTDTLPNVPWSFVPLRTARHLLGAVGVAQLPGGAPLDPEKRTLLDTLVEQTAAALDRVALTEEVVATRGAAETERVRNTVLASISHDFRTPLASILGSATSLLEVGEGFDAPARAALLHDVRREAEHLDQMVRNLLSMTRIESGALELRRDWIDLREVVDRVASAVRRRGAEQSIDVSMPANLPMVGDATLVEQALSNVIGNAIHHTPPDTRVTVDAAVAPDAVSLRVTDNGPGIDRDVMPRLFEKFAHTRSAQESTGDSIGLGLAIAKGIVEAHGGTIRAESPVEGIAALGLS